MDELNQPELVAEVVEQEQVVETAPTALGKLKTAQSTLRDLSRCATASGRAAVTGIVEIDRLLLETVTASVNAGVSHGRAIIGAPSLEVVVDMQKNFVSASVTEAVDRTKDLVELIQAKTQETWAPVLNFGKAK